MFCAHCGAKVQSGQVFCSNCGQPLTGAAPPSAPISPSAAPPQASTGQSSAMTSRSAEVKPSSVAQHVKVLGILWIIYSALRLIPGLALLVFGHARFPFMLSPFPGGFHGLVGPLLSMLGLTFSVLAIAGIIGGLGILSYHSGARVLIIVLACLSLIHFPFGTALGIYTLWVLLSSGADREYQRLRTTR